MDRTAAEPVPDGALGHGQYLGQWLDGESHAIAIGQQFL